MSRGYAAFDNVTMTVGTESANVINVAFQAQSGGQDVATAVSFIVSLHDDASGQTDGTAHSTSPAVGTDGHIQALVTDLTFLCTTESDGDLDIDFTDSGAQTIYAKVHLPDGSFVMSDAITHAA